MHEKCQQRAKTHIYPQPQAITFPSLAPKQTTLHNAPHLRLWAMETLWTQPIN